LPTPQKPGSYFYADNTLRFEISADLKGHIQWPPKPAHVLFLAFTVSPVFLLFATSGCRFWLPLLVAVLNGQITPWYTFIELSELWD
jgi:hypothetical protein